MNLKYIIYIFSFLAFFSACNRKSQNQTQNQIDFGKTQKYLVTKNEKLEAINKDILADYEVLIRPFIDLPLNKYIVSSTEITFIGVSFVLKPDEILKKFKEEGKRIFEKEEADNKNGHFLEKLQKDYYAYYHLYYSKKDNLTYMLIFVDKNKEYITSLYKNESFITKKISKK